MLVSQQASSHRMMTYSSNQITQVSSDLNYLSRSSIHSTVVSARSRTDNQANMLRVPADVQVVSRGQNNDVSYEVSSMRRQRKSPAKKKDPSQISPSNLEATEGVPPNITWSPLPPRRATAAAAESLCVALFCDDPWDDIDDFEKWNEPKLDSTTTTPKHLVPQQPKITCNMSPTSSATKQPDLNELDYLDEEILEEVTFEEETMHSTALAATESPGLQLRPYTNPRDTPTHHPPIGHSPSRRVPNISNSDLTLESIHDLNWLHLMEPDDQAILEVHIIWSILTLMVVLLACYSLQHHHLTG